MTYHRQDSPVHSLPQTPRSVLETQLTHLAQLHVRYAQAETRYNEIMRRYHQKPKALWPQWSIFSTPTIITASIIIFIVAAYEARLLLSFPVSLASLVAGIFILETKALSQKLGKLAVANGVTLLLIDTVIALAPTQIVATIFRALLLLAIVVALLTLSVLVKTYTPIANYRISQENQRRFKSSMEAARNEIAPVAKELDQVRGAYAHGNYAELIPQKYNNIDSIHALLEIVRDHRASTMQEAVNCHVEDLHRQYMRHFADRQVALSQLQFEEQRRNTRSVRFANVMNVGMQAFQGARTRATIRDRFNKR